MGDADRKARAPMLDYSERSRMEKLRPDGDKLAAVVEGIGAFLHDLMIKSETEIEIMPVSLFLPLTVFPFVILFNPSPPFHVF